MVQCKLRMMKTNQNMINKILTTVASAWRCHQTLYALHLYIVQNCSKLKPSWTDQSRTLPVAPMALIANSFICAVCQKNKRKHAILNWATGFAKFVLRQVSKLYCKKKSCWQTLKWYRKVVQWHCIQRWMDSLALFFFFQCFL